MMGEIAKIVEALPAEVIIRIIPTAALLYVIFLLMRYITKQNDAIVANTTAVNKLATIINVMSGFKND